MRDIAGSAAAPAARWRNCRRGSFIGVLLPDPPLHARKLARRAMWAWLDRKNVGLGGVAAGGINMTPKKGGVGTSRWGGSKVSLHQPRDWAEGAWPLVAFAATQHFGRFRSEADID